MANNNLSISTLEASTTNLLTQAQQYQEQQNTQLTELQLLLQQINDGLSVVKKGAAEDMHGIEQATSAQSLTTPAMTLSSNSGASAQALMAMALSMIQALIAQSNNQQTQQSAKMGQSEIDGLNSSYQNALKEVQKAESSSSSVWSWLTKAFTYVATAVGVIASLALGQPEIAAGLVIGLIATESGATSGLANLFSSWLQDMGVSEDAANIIGDVVATVTIVALTLAVTMDPADAAEEVAGEAVDAATSATTDATTTATEETAGNATAEASTTAFQKVSSFLNKVNEYNPFSKLSASTNVAIMNGISSAMSTNLVNDFLTVLPLSEKQKKALEIYLAIELTLLMVMAGAGMAGGSGASSTVESAADDTTLSGKLMKVLGGPQGVLKLQYLSNGLGYMADGFAVGEGVTTIQLGEVMMNLSKDSAINELLQTLMSSLTNSSTQATKMANTMMGQVGLTAGDIDGILAGQTALAQVIASNPV